MRSMIYERTVDDKTEFVYAFQGTDMTSGKDWSDNAEQAINGSAEQYVDAISNSNAITINDAIKGNDSYELSFVGHSLGGGLAAASAYATGNEAVTFNAAGVNQKTLNNNGVNANKGSMNDMIQAFIMTTDPLNGLQNNTPLPNVDGTRNYIKPTSNLSRGNGHSMDNLLSEILKIYQCESECP